MKCNPKWATWVRKRTSRKTQRSLNIAWNLVNNNVSAFVCKCKTWILLSSYYKMSYKKEIGHQTMGTVTDIYYMYTFLDLLYSVGSKILRNMKALAIKRVTGHVVGGYRKWSESIWAITCWTSDVKKWGSWNDEVTRKVRLCVAGPQFWGIHRMFAQVRNPHIENRWALQKLVPNVEDAAFTKTSISSYFLHFCLYWRVFAT